MSSKPWTSLALAKRCEELATRAEKAEAEIERLRDQEINKLAACLLDHELLPQGESACEAAVRHIDSLHAEVERLRGAVKEAAALLRDAEPASMGGTPAGATTRTVWRGACASWLAEHGGEVKDGP